MSSDADSRDQPGLWEAEESATLSVHGKRANTQEPIRQTAADAASELWTVDQVADYLGVPKQTIYCWRTTGYGPAGFRVGKHVRWRASTVIAWTVELERHG
jgi:excisionase family DNA binding protein